MTDLSKLVIYIQSVDDHRWLAATAVAPYFCFEAESEKAVVEKVRHGLQFYRKTLERLVGGHLEGERAKANLAFDHPKKIPARKLVCA